MPNRKERRKELVPTRIQTKFIYKDKDELETRFETKQDGRTIAYIQLEGYASTRAKDGSGDVVEPDGIDLSRFEAGNAPLKAMHGRSVLSNIGVIKEAKVDVEKFGLYIKAEARLDLTEDKNGQKLVQEDYNLYTRLQEGVINGFSIGFHGIKERYDEEKDVNVIYSLQLHEISIVDVPDNPLTIRKMLDMYHEQKESEILDDDLTSMTKKTAENASEEKPDVAVEENETNEEVVEEGKTVPEEEAIAENDETVTEESGVSEEKAMEKTDQKDLMGENSIDDMIQEALKSKFNISKGSREYLHIVDIFKSECVYYHVKFSSNDSVEFEKYCRIGYSIEGSEAKLSGDPQEVQPTTYWIDKKNLLVAMFEKSLSQESQDSGNAVADPNPEKEEVSDEGAKDKSLETKDNDEDEKALEETLSKTSEAFEVIKSQKQLIDKLTEELAKYKGIKVQNGLMLTEEKAKSKPNVFDAVAEQITKSL